MKSETSRYERGSALVVAILAMALLAAIGLGLVLNTQTDRAISRNMQASTKALFTADTGVQKLRTLLDYDYAYDRIGLGTNREWCNRWLIVPPGTTGADQTNSTGSCTAHSPAHNVGLADVWFFDIDPNDIADTNGDGFIDVLLPYYINTSIPGATGSIEGNDWQIMFRNYKKSPTSTRMNENVLSILVVGRSETHGTGLSSANAISGRSSSMRGARFVEQNLYAQPISVWDNVSFMGGPFSDPLLTTMKYFGSVHIINGTAGANTVFMSGNIGWFNYYQAAANPGSVNPPCANNPPDSTLTNILAPQPVGSNGPTLNGKVRVRVGNLQVQDSARIGCPDNAATGKETYDSLYMNGSFAIVNTNIFFDEYDEYDVPEDFLDRLKFPDVIDNTQTYVDRKTGDTFSNYQEFLVGNPDANASTTNYGAAGLDLTPINPNNVDDTSGSVNIPVWAFDEDDADNERESISLLDNIESAVGPTENRGDDGAANAVYANGRSMNILKRNLDSDAGDVPSTSAVSSLLNDTGTGAIVYFGFDRGEGNEPIIGWRESPYDESNVRWVRGGPPGSGTPVTINPPDRPTNHNGAYFIVKKVRYTSGAGTNSFVHGLIFIPKNVTLSALFTNFLFHNAGNADWDTMFPNAPLANNHKGMIHLMNDYSFVVSQDDGDSSTPDPNNNVDIRACEHGLGGACPSYTASPNDTLPPSGGWGTLNFAKSTIIGSGLIMIGGPLYFNSAGNDNSNQLADGINYDGRFTIYVPSWAPGTVALQNPAITAGTNKIHERTFLLPITQFPCNDAIVLLSAGDFTFEGGGTQNRVAAIMYARNIMTIDKQTDYAGTIVSYKFVVTSGSGNPNYLQVPALNGCLPDFLPAKDPITFLGKGSWVIR